MSSSFSMKEHVPVPVHLSMASAPTLSFSPTSSLSPHSSSSSSPFSISYLARSGLVAFAILTPAVLFILQTITLSHHGIRPFRAISSTSYSNSPFNAAFLNMHQNQHQQHTQHTALEHRCNRSVFFNKPPKTASTFIQVVIGQWVQAPYRFVTCGGKRALETNLYLPDCLPQRDDGCTIFSAHVKLNNDASTLVHSRLPTALHLTSTRYPAHRIMSFFLQINRLRSWEDGSSINDERLKNWLQTFNPWSMYNYHAGVARTGNCPLSSQERLDIFDVATKYDVVIDANLVNASNTILEYYGLFQLPKPEMEVTANVRGTLGLNVSEEVRRMIKSVSCVEDELHRAFHMRMASLYEKITGKKCIRHGDINELGSCMEEHEAEFLKNSWVV